MPTRRRAAASAAAPRPRIFLSHSSKDAVLTDAVSAALAASGDGHPGYEVLVDRDCLKPGEEWPIQLHAMMAYAQAGLILLTPAALSRPDWVRKETHILGWRRSLDPSFKVFHVLLGVEPEALDAQGFGPAQLSLLQRVPTGDAQAIASVLRQHGPHTIGASTPFEELASKLANILQDVKPALIRQLATRLHAPPLPWWPGDRNLPVEGLAARMLGGHFGDYAKLVELINELKSLSLSSDALKNVLRWLAPHWLDPVISGQLAAVAHELWAGGQGGIACVNGGHLIDYTAERLVDKAHPFRFDLRVASIEGGVHRADAAYYESQVCAWLREHEEEEFRGRSDAQIVAALAAGDPFLFVPLPLPDAATLRTLRQRLPKVVFLLWTGEQLPERDDALPAVALRPAVPVKDEYEAYKDYGSARRALRR
ncbi:MAG: TIR domain-containing protein [Burkholderiaceae bacterium]|nr:TIR domain-containing protein [Burkholderiaceae bacterium]